MGDIIGGLIGGVGSLLGAGKQAKADKAAAQQALTGYNYLSGNAANQQAQAQGMAAGTEQAGTQGAEAQLLGTQPVQEGTKNAFQNYLNSTGYQFQLGQGSQAITGNAAARGTLNSGATAKALTQFGQNIGSSYFNNYLNQLGGLNTQQGNTAAAGVGAANAVGQAGTSGGGGAAEQTAAGGKAVGGAVSQVGGIAGGLAANNPNFFGSF